MGALGAENVCKAYVGISYKVSQVLSKCVDQFNFKVVADSTCYLAL